MKHPTRVLWEVLAMLFDISILRRDKSLLPGLVTKLFCSLNRDATMRVIHLTKFYKKGTAKCSNLLRDK